MTREWAALLGAALLFAACQGGGGGDKGLGLKDLNGDGQIRILCFGDSITQGFGDNAGEPPEDPPGGFGGYPPRLQALTGVTVINAGVGGEQTGSGLDRLPDTLQQSNPDYVILLEGANDIEHHQEDAAVQNLEAMVEDVFQFGAQPILGTLLPTCCHHQNSVDPGTIEDVNTALEEFAKKDRVPVIDFHTAFKPEADGTVDPASGLIHVPDGLHPTPAGYDLMALTAQKIF